jgi:hypothetical protein
MIFVFVQFKLINLHDFVSASSLKFGNWQIKYVNRIVSSMNFQSFKFKV